MSWLDRFFTSRNYNTVQDEGADVAPQPTLDFVGTGVTVTNDDTNLKSIVTITAGGGSVPTGTGVYLVSGGAMVAAAGTVNLASGTYVTGTLAVGNGGTGSTDYRTATETLTNKSISGSTNTITNVAISTAVSGLGAGVASFLATPSSANLKTALTDETGSGAAVFATGPTLSAPIFSTISNTGTLTLPTSTDTLVGRATTDTLTNKTLTSPVINTPDFGSNNIKTTGYFGTAASPTPTTGNIRMDNTHKIVTRNNANSADACIVQYNTGDVMYFGMNSSFGDQCYGAILGSSTYMYLSVASNYYIHLEASEVLMGYPVVGDGTAYGAHGQITSSMTNANYTVPAAEYKYDTVVFSTVLTAGRTVTFPHPSSAAKAYEKTIFNDSITTQTLTISTGTGTTKTLATGTAQRFRFSNGGVNFAGANFTP